MDDQPNVSRAQMVYNWLKAQIRSGHFKPGQRLPEEEIAASLEVSRTPIREAMSRLSVEGLLVSHPMRGFAVVELQRDQIIDLHIMREILEAASARLAARHASQMEIDALRDLLRESHDAIGNVERLIQLNRSFHRGIAASARNTYLQQALERLGDSLGLVKGSTFEFDGRAKAVIEEHTAILDAIEAHKPEAAEAAAQQHIRRGSQFRLKLIDGRVG